MIAYHFPPDRGAASLRTAKFAQYLSGMGWSPTVLAPRRFHTSAGTDAEAENNLGAEVIRADNADWARVLQRVFPMGSIRWTHPKSTVETSLQSDGGRRWFRPAKWLADNFLFVPDRANLWITACVKAARRWLARERAEVIYSASPYASSHLAALRLQQTAGLPWIADFHDPWTPVTAQYLMPLRRRLDEYLERKIMEHATHVIVTTARLGELYVRKYPFVESKCSVITSGYDPEEFRDLRRVRSDNAFRIVYCGSFYHGIRNPEPLLAAISRLVRRGCLDRAKIELRITGKQDELVQRIAEKHNLQSVVRLTGPLSRRDALQEIVNADLLWEIVGDYACPDVFRPSKTYEYLAAGAPILLFSPSGGEAACLIEGLKAGTVVSDDAAEIDSALLSYVRAHSERRLPIVPRQLDVYTWPNLSQQLAEILDGVTAR